MKTERDYERVLNSLFPTMVKNESNNGEYEYFPLDGITLCDYFAGQALVGLLSSQQGWSSQGCSNHAHAAYKYAEAMLVERIKHSNAIWDEVPGLGKDREENTNES
jgi:hypothetical protein